MTQKDKELLIDLCARLPYGVNGLVTFHKTMGENSTFKSVIDGKLYDRFANLQESWYDNIPSIKPYLRPMSSMTKEKYLQLMLGMIHMSRALKCRNYKKPYETTMSATRFD